MDYAPETTLNTETHSRRRTPRPWRSRNHLRMRPRASAARARPAATRARPGGAPPTARRGDGRAEREPRSTSTPEALDLFLRRARVYPLLTAAEEIELAKRIERGDLEAKERMINSNLRLVVSQARRYQGHGLEMGDLVQEGMLGPDPRGREVRLAARLQVLDLRDALDPPGDPARPPEPRPHDPACRSTSPSAR